MIQKDDLYTKIQYTFSINQSISHFIRSISGVRLMSWILSRSNSLYLYTSPAKERKTKKFTMSRPLNYSSAYQMSSKHGAIRVSERLLL